MTGGPFTLPGSFAEAAEVPATAKSAKTASPFCLRLTKDERARLEREAGNQPLGAYIRERVFGGDQAPRRRQRRPVKDDQALARLLGELGASRLSSNLNQLAKAANTGSLPVTPELEEELQAACTHVRAMRDTLITALGMRVEQ